MDGGGDVAPEGALDPQTGPASPFGGDARGASSPETALRALCGTQADATQPVNRGGAGARGAALALIDEAREDRMGLGRSWRSTGSGNTKNPMPPGTVALHESVASALGVTPGDYVTMAARIGTLTRHTLAPPLPCPQDLPPRRGGVAGARGSALVDNDAGLALR